MRIDCEGFIANLEEGVAELEHLGGARQAETKGANADKGTEPVGHMSAIC